MANVNYETNQIKTAIYGEEVRDAIISALRKVGTEGTELTTALDQIEAELSEKIRKNTADIAIKGDNLYFDEEEKLLYLMSNGEIIGDGIAVSTGGGGGGGGQQMYFYHPRLDNELPDRNITATSGSEVVLKFSYSSVDDQGADDGPGIGRIVIGSVTKKTFTAIQGSNSVDITDILDVGSTKVQVKVENSEGTIRNLTYNVEIIDLSISTTIEPITGYRGAATIYYTVTGSGDKTVHFVLDGTEIGTEVVSSSGRSRSYIVDEQSHGAHMLEIYATSTIDSMSLESEHLKLCMYWIGDSTDPIIATPYSETTVTEGEIIVIPYSVYDPSSEPTSVTLSVVDGEGEIYSEKTITKDRSAGDPWVVSDYPIGNVIFRITVGSTVKNIPVTIEEYDFPIDKVTDSLVLSFSPEGRANTESNPGSWSDEAGHSATFTGFSWIAVDGWLNDGDNVPILRFLPGNQMVINFAPFTDDITNSGYTIEADFATRDVRDYESVVFSCMDGGRGFEIASQKATLKSEQRTVSMLFKEDSHVRATFVVEQKTQNRLVYIYINGIMCGVTQYPTNDNFSQRDPKYLTIGAESCGLDLYSVNCYAKSLSRDEVLDNYICDRPTIRQRQDMYDDNNILTDAKLVSADMLPPDLPYMVFSGPELPQSKGDKKTMTITFVDPVDSSRGFVAAGASVDVQGTSSAKYPVKNLKFTAKNGFTNGSASFDNYELRPGDIPVNKFCIKVDYASSEGANNVELVQLYEELCAELGIQSPAQEEYPDEGIRQGIAGRPIALFWHDTIHNETVFVGKANFNNDKGTPETFGFDKYSEAEAWDFRVNTSDMCLFRSADFSTDEWQTSLESIYPEDYFVTTAVRKPFEFVVAHDPDSVSTEEEKAALKADFKEHLGDYFLVDNLLFYYLFTEHFLMIDSRAKNIHLATYDGIHWLPLPYDMDTANGINNEGELVFEYNLEDTDSIAGDQVYNGQDSLLWILIRECYADELVAMYKRMRSTRIFNYLYVRAMFKNHQSAWPQRMWNEDSYLKYLKVFIESGTDNLAMLQGDKGSQFDWWLYNAFKYRDSKYDTGDATANVITLRAYTDDSHPIENQSLTLTAYAHIYGVVEYASTPMPPQRMVRNETRNFPNPMTNMWDTEIYIHSADRLSDIGDLSAMNVGYCDVSAATKLNRLIVGSAADGYANAHMNTLTIGNNELLTLLNICNCTTLTTPVDLSGCSGIETILATGSAITGVQLPVGGHLETLELPETITNLTVQNQKNLTTFKMAGYEMLSTLRIENTPTINIETVINSATNLSRVRLMGIEWTATNEASLKATIDRLDTCKGLDGDNNTIEKPVVSGRVNISSISSELLIRIQNTYQDLVVVVNGNPQFVVYFQNYDGTTLYNQVVAEGGSATDPVTGGQIQAPTRPDDSDGTSYVYSGWSPLPTNVHANSYVTAQYTPAYPVKYVNDTGTVLQSSQVTHGNSVQYTGSTPTKASTAQYTYAFKEWTGADDRATGRIEQVTAPRTVTATFTSTLRSYTAKFYAEDRTTVLQTSTVEYGASASYTGTTPTSESGEFDGWEPSEMRITADTNFYPKFKGAVEDVEIADSWDTIIANLENGAYATAYKVGNYKPLDLGTEGTINMQIVAIDNEEGPLVFVAKELLVTKKQMNMAATNANGYPATNVMRPYLEETILPLVPANVRKYIKPVTKTSYDKTAGGDVTSVEKLWIPSCREVFGGSDYEQSGPVYSDIFKDATTRKRAVYGSSSFTNWWTRSAYPSNDSSFRRVSSYGSVDLSFANYSNGVCLGFVLSPESIADSWEAIASAVEDGTYRTKYSVGDSKIVDLGDEGAILMEIAGMDMDELADGSGNTAAITWIGKQLLVTKKHMNTAATNANGYPATNVMKPWLDMTIWNKIPANVQSLIKSVKKTSFDYTTQADLTSNEKLWIPSCREVFGGSGYEQSGPVYSGLFPDANSRKKAVYGSSSFTYWWTRSAHPSGDSYFRSVHSGGNVSLNDANYSYGVCLGFSTGISAS